MQEREGERGELLRKFVRTLWKAVPQAARPVMKRIYSSRTMPTHWVPALKAFSILLFRYGYLDSVIRRAPVDGRGGPLPWYTYPAIEFINQLDFTGKTVFEFGSGFSTLFWAARAKRVVSVENDAEWYRIVREQLPANCELLLETDLDRYADAITQYPEGFDVIVVDGGSRRKCCLQALNALKKGGVIVLDNSDWSGESSYTLRNGGLLEVDMTGFAPINAFTCTTSFYFERSFNVPPRGDRQPAYGVGAKRMDWEAKETAARRLAEQNT